MVGEIHLVLRYQYGADGRTPTDGKIRQHLQIINKEGSVWFGVRMTPRLEMLERIDYQIAEGHGTYAFLYESGTPNELSESGHRWFRANVVGVSSGKPEDVEFIPEYYREDETCPAYFRFNSIDEIRYDKENFPLLQAQNPMRYAILEGEPRPENLRMYRNPDRPVVRATQNEEAEEFLSSSSDVVVSREEPGKSDNLSKKVIELQEKIIGLQDRIVETQAENEELRVYKERFDKIRGLESIFADEKSLEDWLERNMHKVAPSLEVIDRQIRATWPDGKFGRQDMFCMNKETKQLVIVEVKTRGRKVSSAYDQYVRYTTYARVHLDEINHKYRSRGLKATKDLVFMIITDFTNDEMIAVCEDHGIGLVRLFGGIGIEFPRGK